MALAAAGCGHDPAALAAPAPLAGTYDLVRVGATPLPIFLGGSPGLGFTTLRAERLVLAADGTATDVATDSVSATVSDGPYNGQPPSLVTVTLTGTWTQAGGAPTLRYTAGLTASSNGYARAYPFDAARRLTPAAGGVLAVAGGDTSVATSYYQRAP